MSEQGDLKQNIRQLSELISRSAQIQKDLAAQQSQLSGLQQKQREVQQEQQRLNHQLSVISQNFADAVEAQRREQEKQSLILEQQLATQREIEINTQRSAADEHIQTLLQQQAEVRRQRQQSLKDTFFSLRQTLDEYTANPKPMLRFLLLKSLQDVVQEKNLLSGGLEEISDKEYADRVLRHLEDEFHASKASLTVADQNDLCAWKELPPAIDSGARNVHVIEDRVRSLPGRIAQCKADLERFKRLQSEGTQKRQNYGLRAKFAFALSILLAVIIVGVSLARQDSEFPSVLLFCAPTAIYELWNLTERNRLDHTKDIQTSQKEMESLEDESRNTPDTVAHLEADRSLLQQEQRQLEEIYTRHPELRNFNLPQL